MTPMITAALAGLGRRIALWGTLSGAILIAAWVLLRQGRPQARAELAIRRAEARIRAMQSARETRHDVETLPEDERARRLARWMRD